MPVNKPSIKDGGKVKIWMYAFVLILIIVLPTIIVNANTLYGNKQQSENIATEEKKSDDQTNDEIEDESSSERMPASEQQQIKTWLKQSMSSFEGIHQAMENTWVVDNYNIGPELGDLMFRANDLKENVNGITVENADYHLVQAYNYHKEAVNELNIALASAIQAVLIPYTGNDEQEELMREIEAAEFYLDSSDGRERMAQEALLEMSW